MTGCIRLTEVNGWAVIHDPRARAVFLCKNDGGVACCRAEYHGYRNAGIRVCKGAAIGYGRRRWLLGRPLTPTEALERILVIAHDSPSKASDTSAQEELERRLEIESILETL